MRTLLGFLLICCAFLSASSSSYEEDVILAKEIKQNQNYSVVYSMAQDLLKDGFNAGGGYADIWIRDTNTFLEVASTVVDHQLIRKVLIKFFVYQYANGGIVDGYNPSSGGTGKNTVETDQESSLIQAVYRYIKVSGDVSILNEVVSGKKVIDRIQFAFEFLINNRHSLNYGLLWGATTIDWGDVQPEDFPGIIYDNVSHPTIDIYDNAMWVIALNNYLEMLTMLGQNGTDNYKLWEIRLSDVKNNIRKYLWDGKKFIPHIYLERNPFPPNFNENEIYYHGGTAVAIQAGLLEQNEILNSYEIMKDNVKKAGAQSIGMTIYPPYPWFWVNNGLAPWLYQNAGDWTWFGARMVSALVENGYAKEANEAILPMINRVIVNNGFWEWWTREGVPSGSPTFHGSAGVLGKAIQQLQQWADKTLENTKY